MADQKPPPSTGDGRKRGKRIGKAEVNVQRPSGSFDWKQIGKLWGKKKKS